MPRPLGSHGLAVQLTRQTHRKLRNVDHFLNLTDSGLKDNSTAGTKYDIDWLSDAIGQGISVPEELYRAQSEASLQATVDQLGIIGDVPITNYSL